MTTTNTWLKTAGASELAFSLVFEGYNLVFTTTSDTAGIATAFAGTDWTVVKSGLRITGTVGQEIELFKPRVATNSMSFQLVDADGTIRLLLLGNASTTAVTYATEDLSASATSWNVRDTTDFAASGTIYSGSEAIAYTAKSGAPDPAFTGLTRGKWSLWGTDADSKIGRVHRGQVPRPVDSNGPRLSPEIRATPNVWYNRAVALLQHHKEGGVWSTVTLPLYSADAKVVWAGRIKEWADSGDGTIELSALSINELLTSTVFADQYEADAMSICSYYRAVHNQVRIHYSGPTGGTVAPYTLQGTMSPTTGWEDGFYDADDLVAQIQERLNQWTSNSAEIPRSGSNPYHRWSVDIRQTGDGLRTVFEVETTYTLPDSFKFRVALSAKVLDTLGYSRGTMGMTTDDAKHVVFLELENGQSATRTIFRAISDSAPKMGLNPGQIGVGDYIPAANETGVWMTQPTFPAEANADENGVAEGYLQVGDSLFNVLYQQHTFGAGPAAVTVPAFLVLYSFQAPSPTNDFRYDERGTIEDFPEPLRLKQVWVERGKVGDLLTKVMLSTGSSAYNHASYDVYEEGFGIGVPADLVDIDTFINMDSDYEIMLDKPTPFKDVLESVCHVYGRHIIFANGRLTLTRPGFDSPNDESIIALDEDSKADSPGRPEIRYSSDGIINRIELIYTTLSIQLNRNTDPNSSSRATFTSVNRISNRVVVADATSESAFGHRRTLQITAAGILDTDAWAEYVAKPAITYFTRPFGIITRSISVRGAHLVPGDIVLLTDNFVVDPATGGRGVAGLACWVKMVEFDWTRGAGRIELVFLPDHDASYLRTFSPAALMTSYNAGTKTITCAAHTYSRSTDAVDASHFELNDKIQLRELSPTTTSAPSVLTDTVVSVSGDDIVVSAGVAPVGGKTYVVEAQPVSSATTPQLTQRNHAFLADDDTRLVNAAYPASRWAGSTKSLDTFTQGVTYSQQFIKPADDDSDANQPLSSRKFVNAFSNLNNLNSYKTRNVLVNHQPFAGVISTASTSYVLVFGPVFVPLYGINENSPVKRTIVGKVLLNVSTIGHTTTFRLSSSVSMPTGTSMTAPSYPLGSRTATVTYTGFTYAWRDITAFSPAVVTLDGVIGTWLTGELKVESGYTAGFNGLSLVESAI